jgi:hypothetical protein
MSNGTIVCGTLDGWICFRKIPSYVSCSQSVHVCSLKRNSWIYFYTCVIYFIVSVTT